MNQEHGHETPENQKAGKLMIVLLILIFILFGAIVVYALELG
jgi:flagellar basal body-associated protein FliL